MSRGDLRAAGMARTKRPAAERQELQERRVKVKVEVKEEDVSSQLPGISAPSTPKAPKKQRPAESCASSAGPIGFVTTVHGVTVHMDVRGIMRVYGGRVRAVRKQLVRIFKFKKEKSGVYMSTWELTEEEEQYVKDSLTLRKKALTTGGDDLVCIPDRPLPRRFQLKDAKGNVLKGPNITGSTGRPWNIGRQYFSSFQDRTEDSFIWADGSRPYEDKEPLDRCQRYVESHLGELLSSWAEYDDPCDECEEEEYEEYEGFDPEPW